MTRFENNLFMIVTVLWERAANF